MYLLILKNLKCKYCIPWNKFASSINLRTSLLVLMQKPQLTEFLNNIKTRQQKQTGFREEYVGLDFGLNAWFYSVRNKNSYLLLFLRPVKNN